MQTARQNGPRSRAEHVGPHHIEGGAIQTHLGVKGAAAPAEMVHVDREMVLEILAHAGQAHPRRDAHRAQMVGLANSRQHQELRRVEHTAREQHLARDRDSMEAAVLGVFDADRARPLEDDPGRERVRLDPEVGPPHGRPQKGDRSAAAAAVPDGPLRAAEALLVLAVVVLGQGPVRVPRRVEPAVEQGVAISRIDDRERAVAAAPGVLALFPALAALEVGQDVGIRPAVAAVLRPSVVVAAVAAHVGHHVDRGASAEHLAAHRFDAAVVQPELGLGVVAPVEHAMLPDLAEPDRDVDEGMGIAPAGFEQQHLDRRVGGETIGEDAAGRARPNDDVVVALAPGHR